MHATALICKFMYIYVCTYARTSTVTVTQQSLTQIQEEHDKHLSFRADTLLYSPVTRNFS